MGGLIRYMVVAAMFLTAVSGAALAQQADSPKSALEQIEDINREIDADPQGWLEKRKYQRDQEYQNQLYQGMQVSSGIQQENQKRIQYLEWALVLCIIGFVLAVYRKIRRNREFRNSQED